MIEEYELISSEDKTGKAEDKAILLNLGDCHVCTAIKTINCKKLANHIKLYTKL